jgi:hypothetical protein
MEGARRSPAKYKELRDIRYGDGRISVIGKVIKFDNGLGIDDGTGKAALLTDKNIKPGDLVRIIGFVTQTKQIRVELVQNFEGFDIDLYKKAIKI